MARWVTRLGGDNIFVTHVKWQRSVQQNSRSAHPHLDNSGEILDFERKCDNPGVGIERVGYKDIRIASSSQVWNLKLTQLACQDFKPHWELPATLVLGGRARLPEKSEGDEENIDVSPPPAENLESFSLQSQEEALVMKVYVYDDLQIGLKNFSYKILVIWDNFEWNVE